MLIHHEPLEEITRNILLAAGAAAEDATVVAAHLTLANLKGHDSHGVGMVPSYVNNIESGFTSPGNHANVVRDHGAILRIDGQRGLGQVVAEEAMALGLERVRDTGIVCVALGNATHIGRVGTYGERCADAGFVSMHYVNVVGHAPIVVPYGGREPRMVTNPFCCVVPRSDGDHVALDMATSSVAAGKVRVAFMKGTNLTGDFLVDEHGVPTADPTVFMGRSPDEPRGWLLPFGLHKGYALMVMCELLGGGLAGHWTMQPGNERPGGTVNNMLSVIIDPAIVGDLDVFNGEVEAMVTYLRGTPAAAGFEEILIPGDPERRTMAQRTRDGIDVAEWDAIVAAGDQVGYGADAIASVLNG